MRVTSTWISLLTPLSTAFVLEKGQLFLTATAQEDLKGWEKTRQVVYDFVNGRANLAPGTMLLRALELAYLENELQPEFFLLTDDEAIRIMPVHSLRPFAHFSRSRLRTSVSAL